MSHILYIGILVIAAVFGAVVVWLAVHMVGNALRELAEWAIAYTRQPAVRLSAMMVLAVTVIAAIVFLAGFYYQAAHHGITENQPTEPSTFQVTITYMGSGIMSVLGLMITGCIFAIACLVFRWDEWVWEW